jgi:hypothetical protein
MINSSLGVITFNFLLLRRVMLDTYEKDCIKTHQKCKFKYNFVENQTMANWIAHVFSVKNELAMFLMWVISSSFNWNQFKFFDLILNCIE